MLIQCFMQIPARGMAGMEELEEQNEIIIFWP